MLPFLFVVFEMIQNQIAFQHGHVFYVLIPLGILNGIINGLYRAYVPNPLSKTPSGVSTMDVVTYLLILLGLVAGT